MTARRLLRLVLTCGCVVGGFFLCLISRDLFYAIPWPVRKAFGWLGFVGLLGVLTRRLIQVRQGDDLPPGDSSQDSGSPWLAGLGVVVVAALAIPLLRHPENLGFGDWDWFLGRFEGARKSIMDYGQFPWWDPWTRGGFPLAANPQCGVGGVAMPLVLGFGTSVGMRLATLVCFLLAFEGARRLAWLWLSDPVAAVFAAFVYSLNGGVLVAAVAGFHIVMCYSTLPWLLSFVFRLERRRQDGIWLGCWAAFNLLNGIQYLSVYTSLIVLVVWCRRLVVLVSTRTNPTRFVGHTVLAGGIFFALVGWRLATTALVYRDFPRAYATGYDETPWTILTHLLGRPSASVLAHNGISYFWETSCYVGPVVLILAVVSLRSGWRWWHTLTLLCGWLAAGSVAWYHPSYWLTHFPGFATMHAVPRWRFMALLGMSLAAASVIARWNRDGRRSRRWLATLATLVMAGDYLTYGSEILPVAFSIAPTEDQFPGPDLPPGQIVQIANSSSFAAVSRGYGIVYGYEPLLGYDRMASTERHYRREHDDRGEAWTDQGPAQVLLWSPNRIVLKVQPAQRVFINQNPGSWWWLNGQPAFASWRVAEKDRVFAVIANDQGDVDLQIHPRGLWFGGLLHLIGFVVAGVTWLVLGRFSPGSPGSLALASDRPSLFDS